jgi:hypothetical protein
MRSCMQQATKYACAIRVEAREAEFGRRQGGALPYRIRSNADWLIERLQEPQPSELKSGARYRIDTVTSRQR